MVGLGEFWIFSFEKPTNFGPFKYIFKAANKKNMLEFILQHHWHKF